MNVNIRAFRLSSSQLSVLRHYSLSNEEEQKTNPAILRTLRGRTNQEKNIECVFSFVDLFINLTLFSLIRSAHQYSMKLFNSGNFHNRCEVGREREKFEEKPSDLIFWAVFLAQKKTVIVVPRKTMIIGYIWHWLRQWIADVCMRLKAISAGASRVFFSCSFLH